MWGEYADVDCGLEQNMKIRAGPRQPVNPSLQEKKHNNNHNLVVYALLQNSI